LVALKLPVDLFEWLQHRREVERKNMSELIREGIGLLKQDRELWEKGLVLRLGPERVKIDGSDLKLLDDICETAGIENYQEAISRLILVMHVLMKAGIMEVLRPVPELAEMVRRREFGGKRRTPRTA